MHIGDVSFAPGQVRDFDVNVDVRVSRPRMLRICMPMLEGESRDQTDADLIVANDEVVEVRAFAVLDDGSEYELEPGGMWFQEGGPYFCLGKTGWPLEAMVRRVSVTFAKRRQVSDIIIYSTGHW